MTFSREDRVNMFVSLFKGRIDVFARRWEKFGTNVSGYAPVYTDWSKKSYLPLDNNFIEKHLIGDIVLGLYPLLLDNTSYFTVADFDGERWVEPARQFMAECQKYNLPAYLERSRSGKGAHVWCFFSEKYPAHKSRLIFLTLLRNSKNIGDFEKEDSFDRLFPNQDYLSGKGLGNLIALPLHGKSRKENNTVFLNHETFEPYEDQWQFLSEVQKISTEKLGTLYAEFSNQKDVVIKSKKKSGLITITLAENLSIPKNQISGSVTTFLQNELNFFNAEYKIKQNIGLPTFDTEKYFKAVLTEGGSVLIPRGFLKKLTDHLKEQGINFEIEDKRKKLDEISIKSSAKLFDYQEKALENFNKAQCGVLVAPPGSGKTVMALELISRKKQPALIITHRKQIYTQWLERIESFLNMPRKEIGRYCSTKKSIKYPVTVAMVQTLNREKDWNKLKSAFGTVIVDECHHVPAHMFRGVVSKFDSYYLFGLTATPERRGNDDKLIYAYMGDIVAEIQKNYQIKNENKVENKKSNKIEITIRETNLSLPFIPKIRDFQTVAKILSFDSERNKMIAEDVSVEANGGKRCLVLTERKEHVEQFNFYLKRDFETIAFTSDLSLKQRKQKEKQIQSGNFQILIATGQMLGEGTDIHNLDCLFLVFPFSFEGKLTQYIGRIERGEERIRKVYDYRDANIAILDSMFKNLPTI